MKIAGVPVIPLRSPLRKSSATARREHFSFEIGLETIDFQSEGQREMGEIGVGQVRLMVVQQVVHFPEFALSGGGLRRLGGHARLRMDRVLREMAKNEPQAVAKLRSQPLHDWKCGGVIRTLIIAVLNERDRRDFRPHRVIARPNRQAQLS